MTLAAHDPLQSESPDDSVLTTALIGRAFVEVMHDLSGHLSTVLGALALARFDLDETHPAAARLSAAEQAAHEINTLRSYVLSYVRGDDMPPAALDLNALISADLPMMERLLADRADSHVRISARLAPDLAYILAEPTPLRRVLLNLVVNARDACGERGHVVITTRNQDMDDTPHVILSVRDNGSGMSAETRARILTPGGHTTKGSRGSGLGIVACRRTVAAYGGRLEVKSAEGYGTVVTVALPALCADELGH